MVMRWLYRAGIALYGWAAWLAAWWNPKARQFVRGRRETFPRLAQWNATARTGHPVAWFHCASLGEFEQGRPLMERLRARRPEVQIVLTFFSPSGHAVRSQWPGADLVLYLPLDTPRNAARWVEELRPSLAVCVKYEIWPHTFLALKRAGVPLLVVSAIFRRGHRYFGWQKSFWLPVLQSVTRFFVQNETSVQLLQAAGVLQAEVAGDTRYDRVAEFAAAAQEQEDLRAFLGSGPVLVAGSSYAPEERTALRLLERMPAGFRVVIAPHELDESRLERLMERLGDRGVRWSRWDRRQPGQQVLVMDRMGLLAGLYRHADLVLLGGGFGRGIHNSLEAAAFGAPLVFGPQYRRFDEAVRLVEAGAARACESEPEMEAAALDWLEDPAARRAAGLKAWEEVQARRGAVDLIYAHMEKLLASGGEAKK